MRSCGQYASIPYLPEHYNCEPQPGGSIPGCIDELPLEIASIPAATTDTSTEYQPKEPGQRMVDIVFEDDSADTDLDVVDVTDFNNKSMRRNVSGDTTNVADRIAVASAQGREQFCAYGAGVGAGGTTLGKIPFPAWNGNSSNVQNITLRNNDTTAAKDFVKFSIVFYTPDRADFQSWHDSANGHKSVPKATPGGPQALAGMTSPGSGGRPPANVP